MSNPITNKDIFDSPNELLFGFIDSEVSIINVQEYETKDLRHYQVDLALTDLNEF